MGEAATDTFRLIYRSRNLIPEDQRKAELGTLFGQARSNNKRHGITGALLLSDDWFVQTLEGDEDAVRTLFTHIEKDSRHDSVSVIETGQAERVFSKWAMARVAADGEPDIALIAHVDGIHRAARQRTTADQESVLDVMRDAARGN
jgi:predicted sulfurtransferase